VSDHNLSAPVPPASQPTPLSPLPVTVLICTRNRGNSLVPTVRSILADPSCTELLILDQSSNDATECALADFRDDARLRYLRSTTRGKGLALNEGLRIARCEIVAITDDDCEVAPDWLLSHLEAFARYPHLALTYGNVLPVEHNPALGFIPTYYVPRDGLITNIWQKLPARGIGANTAVRRDVILQMGGFDPELCPGGVFHACVDRDMTIRCVLSGHAVYETRASNVYHYGFRNWEQGRTLACNAFYGIGAAHAKALKCGYGGAFVLMLWEFMVYALIPALLAAATLRRPFGVKRLLGFMRGVRDGWRFPMDRQHILFQQASINERPLPHIESKDRAIR
jgi:glycosyltransferase involved in cell wall biosynthesis